MSHFPVPPLFLPEGPPGILLSPLHHPRRDNPRRSRLASPSIGSPTPPRGWCPPGPGSMCLGASV